ncbi:HI1506-related protein [Citrobacter portucalensis]|uniref:HI1506-related protein n=1 Tax=Citrobacter portucalensis TaxID=1639133 RepID=UPI00226B2D19|nr:HI1506-related protein [Citrobacter portucalensis]MCX9038768.1 HI1506-related protein [Citrobacter portucalensis]
MPVKITAKRDGFRRCGIAHSETTTTWADGHFTEAQLRELESEPNLVVLRVADVAEFVSQQDELIQVKARVIELEAVVLQLNTDAVELKSALDSVTAERDDLQVKLGLLTSTGADAVTGQEQASQSDATQDTGAGDDKKSDKKKG